MCRNAFVMKSNELFVPKVCLQIQHEEINAFDTSSFTVQTFNISRKFGPMLTVLQQKLCAERSLHFSF